MVHNNAHHLEPTTTSFSDIASFVARLRHNLRTIESMTDRNADAVQAVRAEVQALKDHGNPFDSKRILRLEQWVNEVDEDSRALAEKVRRYGYLLVEAAPQIDAITTLTERCELLNVNVADRARLSEDDGVLMILFVHGLEDSAERRHCAFKHGPLFHALELALMDFLATPQGQAAGNAFFESGGMFEWLPWYRVNSNGSMTRMPPPPREARPSDSADEEPPRCGTRPNSQV